MKPIGPLVSILTPSLNQARWLSDNLESVARQSYGNVEHIVTDGGSTDGSVDILNAAPPHVRWTSSADEGQSAALNEAYRMSRGEIIGWLNSDDALFHRRVLERVLALLKARPDVEAVYGHAALVNADGLLLHYLWAPPFDARRLRRFNFICQPTVFLRRRVIGEQLVDENFDYTMDRELWLRLSETSKFERIDDVLAVDRHHPMRKSYLRLDLAREDRLRLLERYGTPLPDQRVFRNKLLKIAFRTAGLPLAVRHVPELAFDGYLDSRLRLVGRQIAQLRAWMPVGSSPEA
jgi:glycosyltransferase involved in cell wall biosynthesis